MLDPTYRRYLGSNPVMPDHGEDGAILEFWDQPHCIFSKCIENTVHHRSSRSLTDSRVWTDKLGALFEKRERLILPRQSTAIPDRKTVFRLQKPCNTNRLLNLAVRSLAGVMFFIGKKTDLGTRDLSLKQ